jgi:hypothetical protein
LGRRARRARGTARAVRSRSCWRPGPGGQCYIIIGEFNRFLPKNVGDFNRFLPKNVGEFARFSPYRYIEVNFLSPRFSLRPNIFSWYKDLDTFIRPFST